MTKNGMVWKTVNEFQPYVTFFVIAVFWNILNKTIGRAILGLDMTLYSNGTFLHHPEIGKLHDLMTNLGFFVILYFTVIRHYFLKLRAGCQALPPRP
jgi:hypothetical protein